MRRISVECYAGHRADERPRRVAINGQKHVVARLLSESVEQSLGSKDDTRHYRILTEDGLVLDILHAGDGEWYLEFDGPRE
ncbi:MAG TPA: hypothetical protein VGL29_02050 [Blastocatellia bacterium]|jgi:hypothetical protein